MYSTARKISTFSMILICINIAGAVLVTLLLMSQQLNFAQLFTLLLYLVTSTTILLLLTVSVRSMLQDLEIEYTTNLKQLKNLKEKVDTLEKKLN